MEKLLNMLHYGWCSHIMEHIKGDLALIRIEKLKSDPNDFVIADIGRGIEKLLDVIEISVRIDEHSKPFLKHGASLRGKDEDHELFFIGEPMRTFKLTLGSLVFIMLIYSDNHVSIISLCNYVLPVHPETAFRDMPEFNGMSCPTTTSSSSSLKSRKSEPCLLQTGASGKKNHPGSIFQHIMPPNECANTWQMFFDTLHRSLSLATFLVQENIETARGHIFCTHIPDMMR
jgi:hypothetical protein